MAMKFVDLPIKNGDVPVRFLHVYQRVYDCIPSPVATPETMVDVGDNNG
jgi:hypothetical protein